MSIKNVPDIYKKCTCTLKMYIMYKNKICLIDEKVENLRNYRIPEKKLGNQKRKENRQRDEEDREPKEKPWRNK